MEDELYELRTYLAQADTPMDFMTRAWHDSLKNGLAVASVGGMADAFLYTGAINQFEYTTIYKMIGL